MDKKFTNILKYSVSLALMLLFLYLAFRGVKVDDFLSGLSSTNWVLILCSMCCGISAFVLRSLRWRQLLLPLDSSISFGRVFDGVNIGNLANCGLPFAGEFVRCAVVCTPSATYDRVLGTIALERIWDLLSVALIAVLALAIKGGRTALFLEENLVKPVQANAGELCWKFLALALALVILLLVVRRFKDSNRLCAKIHSVLRGMLSGFVSFAAMKGKALFLLFTVLIWTCYWLMCVCITYAFPPSSGLQLSDTLFIMSVGNLASFIPVPGGFGAYHYIVRLALNAIYSVPLADGLVYATLSHESQALTMTAVGLACFIHLQITLKHEKDPDSHCGGVLADARNDCKLPDTRAGKQL